MPGSASILERSNKLPTPVTIERDKMCPVRDQ